MPYRRLPNTDLARLRALNAALQKGKELPLNQLAFSASCYGAIMQFLPKYEASVNLYKKTFISTNSKNKGYQALYKKAKIYISHFIQVFNMAIARGEIKSSERKYFGLSENDSRVPNLSTENDVIEWGERIINGENERRKNNCSPVFNPTIATVQVRYKQFMDAYRSKETDKQTNNRVLGDSSALRKEADAIILQLWNEVEEHFKHLGDRQMREKAKEYGVVYVYRKNEMLQDLRSLFEP